MQRYIGYLLLLVTLYGCAEGKLATESGKPEVFLEGKEPKTVIEGIAAWSAMEGYQTESSSDFMIKTKRQMLMFGLATTTWITTTYTVVKKGTGTKVYAQEVQHELGSLEGNSSSSPGAFGEGTELKTTTKMKPAQDKPLKSQSDYEEIQVKLEKIKAFISGS